MLLMPEQVWNENDERLSQLVFEMDFMDHVQVIISVHPP